MSLSPAADKAAGCSGGEEASLNLRVTHGHDYTRPPAARQV
jgi:hypothetical protein